MNEQPANNQQESIEELFHFIHPSIDSSQELFVHYEVKRLVTHHGIQDICQYLNDMARDKKILLPLMPSVAYTELVRMGMPDGEGYTLKTFMKYYKK